jgi:hypothetical protein
MLECASHAVQLVPDFQCKIFCICQLRDQLPNSDFAFWGTETELIQLSSISIHATVVDVLISSMLNLASSIFPPCCSDSDCCHKIPFMPQCLEPTVPNSLRSSLCIFGGRKIKEESVSTELLIFRSAGDDARHYLLLVPMFGEARSM